MAMRARISSSDHYGPQRGKTDRLESPLGHERSNAAIDVESASPPEADIALRRANRRLAPEK
jgi:hypothetical protein